MTKRDIRVHILSVSGFSAYPVGMHVRKYVLVNNLGVVNVYWAITSYCPGNNYHIHPVFDFDLPTH